MKKFRILLFSLLISFSLIFLTGNNIKIEASDNYVTVTLSTSANGPLSGGKVNTSSVGSSHFNYDLIKQFENTIKNAKMRVYPPGEMFAYDEQILTVFVGSTNKIGFVGTTSDIGFDWKNDTYQTGTLYHYDTGLVALDSVVIITFDIKVNLDTEAPVINGETNYIVNVDNPPTEATIKSGLFAIDNVDGHIPSSSFTLVSDGYTSNKNKIGLYEIKYTVSDSAGNVSAVTVKVHVKDVVKPTITGTSSYTIAYNQTQSLTTVLNNLSASDNYDTNLTIQLVNDGYTSNKTTKGTYNVTYKVTDSSGNQSNIFTVKITVVDNVKPVITGPNSFTAVYNSKMTTDSIKNQLSATDGYDGNITNKITVKSDNYSANYDVKGTYTIVFEVKDNSNNEQTYNVTVSVIDNIKPTISGTATYNIGSTANLTEATIRAALSATDGYDGALTLVLIEDNYSRNPNIIKSHTLKYKATDSSGNTQEFVVTVNVFDDVPPQIFTNDTFINVDGSLNMSIEEIITHLIKVGSLSATVNFENYYVSLNNYDSGTPGFYEVEMSRKITADPNLKETYSIGIRVFEAATTPGPIFTTDPAATNYDWMIYVGISLTVVILLAAFIFTRKKRK